MNPQILTRFVGLITNIIEALLGFRIILKLLGASSSAPFVTWIYNTTDPLLHPFRGMFPSPELALGLELEFSAIFALIIYSFLGYIIADAISMVESRASKRK